MNPYEVWIEKQVTIVFILQKLAVPPNMRRLVCQHVGLDFSPWMDGIGEWTLKSCDLTWIWTHNLSAAFIWTCGTCCGPCRATTRTIRQCTWFDHVQSRRGIRMYIPFEMLEELNLE